MEVELEQVLGRKVPYPSSHARTTLVSHLLYHTPSPIYKLITVMSTDPRRRAQPPPPPPPPEDVPDTTTMGLDGNTDPSQTIATNGQPQAPAKPADDGFKLKFCTVCASNNNRYAPPIFFQSYTCNIEAKILTKPPDQWKPTFVSQPRPRPIPPSPSAQAPLSASQAPV